MDAPNPTVNNSALWAEYMHRQWGFWLEPAGVRNISTAIGASIAASYAFWFEAIIGRLYADNAPPVTNFLNRLDEVKKEAAIRQANGDPADTVPQWMAVLEDVPVEDAQVGGVLAGV